MIDLYTDCEADQCDCKSKSLLCNGAEMWSCDPAHCGTRGLNELLAVPSIEEMDAFNSLCMSHRIENVNFV